MVQAPRFEVDPLWPKPLPNHWAARRDDRRRRRRAGPRVDRPSRQPGRRGRNGPRARIRRSRRAASKAPPVLEFDPGRQRSSRHWGGPGDGLRLAASRTTASPSTTRATSGSAATSGPTRSVLKFTQDGKFLVQFGTARARARAATTRRTSAGVAKIFVDPKNNEAYIADGYGNKRVVVIDADTGKFKRYWGAYGNKPDDTNLGAYNPDAPPSQQFRNPVHCAELSNDGLVYVCDRPNDRIQVFKPRRQVREGSLRREEDARRRLGVGHRVLEGPAAEVHLPGRRQEREDLRHAARVARRS